jgi:hypothetical protein
MIDRLQTQRFELKFQIDEALAQTVRQHVRAFLEPDSFGETTDAPSYPVHSLYLDSPDMQLYQSTINGDRNRFKLRVRYYDDDPKSAVYFEIKRRADRCIYKQRALVCRAHVAALLAGQTPSLHHLARADVKQLNALRAFCSLARELDARPRAHVAYAREAWLSHAHNNVRVTFDRQVQCEPVHDVRLSTALHSTAMVFNQSVILELKFTDRYPRWLQEIVCALNLTQARAAKYVDGVSLVGPRAFAPAASPAHRTIATAASVSSRESLPRTNPALAQPSFA